ncbi:regulator of hemoglobinization and erythroid cell expansion protein isoform X3 [Gallus gallus]|uniref:regulator of hemoglobinization and erythroid cell expansion protein isoform X3 n=1 Tax=Gallus gallus TaxID=9031 RepID=UPI000D63EB20|nr:regulator of hemoglobinization and erythroid cell expansion protein isoform X3 [Gallus gallus]|eukprot:XP_024999656.1 regulator of hemoglobinization and erythroid cell expansion protein isoform X2 [Gallus gallus]
MAEMEHCVWWVPVVTSAVTLLLYALLLLLLYIMLSRKIGRHCCSAQVSGGPAAQPQQLPTSTAGGEGVQRPNYTGSSETSSETSEDSDSSSLHPQGRATGRAPIGTTRTSRSAPITSTWTQKRRKLISGPSPAPWHPRPSNTRR